MLWRFDYDHDRDHDYDIISLPEIIKSFSSANTPALREPRQRRYAAAGRSKHHRLSCP
jgi:hypothetical protein